MLSVKKLFIVSLLFSKVIFSSSLNFVKNDDVEAFNNYYNNYYISNSFLREAAFVQAHKIVNFIIDNELIDINSDPATITWFALWRQYDLDKLVKKLDPSLNTLKEALSLLQGNCFGASQQEKNSAKKLLLSLLENYDQPYKVRFNKLDEKVTKLEEKIFKLEQQITDLKKNNPKLKIAD